MIFIGICFFGVLILLLFFYFRVFFEIRKEGLYIGKKYLSKDLIDSFSVFESYGSDEGFYNKISIVIKLKSPAFDQIERMIRSVAWIDLSDDKREIYMEVKSPQKSKDQIKKFIAEFWQWPDAKRPVENGPPS